MGVRIDGDRSLPEDLQRIVARLRAVGDDDRQRGMRGPHQTAPYRRNVCSAVGGVFRATTAVLGEKVQAEAVCLEPD